MSKRDRRPSDPDRAKKWARVAPVVAAVLLSGSTITVTALGVTIEVGPEPQQAQATLK